MNNPNPFPELDTRLGEHNSAFPRAAPVALFAGGQRTPDMSIIKPERPPAPVMSHTEFDFVFGPWAGWLKSAAEVKGAPVDYVALALLTSASAIIGNTRWAVPWDGWKEPPVLWGMLIGDPSAGKSPALDAVLDPIKEIEAELTCEYQAARKEWGGRDEIAKLVMAQWKSEAKASLADSGEAPQKPKEADAGAPPVRKRIRITDATTEKVADLLSSTWRGLLMSRDELSGWLGSMDRYNGGGDRPFWLEAFGGRSYAVDRKNSPEPITIDHLTISVLGGTQPDKLDSLLLHSDDDGLLARFLTVYPDPMPLSRPTVKQDNATPLAAFKRLYSVEGYRDEKGTKHPHLMHFDDAAQDTLQAFRHECVSWGEETGGLLKSHIGKLPGLVVRAAFVLAMLDWAIDAEAQPVTGVTADHMTRACQYVGQHLRQHAQRAYGGVSVAPEVRAARRIAELIVAERPEDISTRDIQRRGLAGLTSAKEIGPAIQVLCEAHWIALIETKGTGRPPKRYLVNPALGAA